MPASWCDAHHLVHWADDGPTDLSNAALLCERHHTVVHTGRYAGRLVHDELGGHGSSGTSRSAPTTGSWPTSPRENQRDPAHTPPHPGGATGLSRRRRRHDRYQRGRGRSTGTVAAVDRGGGLGAAAAASPGGAVGPQPRSPRTAVPHGQGHAPRGLTVGQWNRVASSSLSTSAASRAAAAASPASPRAAECSRARTVSSRIPVREACSRMVATQCAVSGCAWVSPSVHRASRM